MYMFPVIRSDQNHLARHSKKGKKTRQTEEEVGRQHQGMDRPGVAKSQRAVKNREKMEETGCEVTCARTTLRVKGKVKVEVSGEMSRALVRLRGNIDGLGKYICIHTAAGLPHWSVVNI